MARNTHDRRYDHHSVDLDTNIVLDGATSTYISGAGLHTVLAGLDASVSSMSSAIYNGLDFRQLEAAPSSATEGYSYYDLTDHTVKTWNGSEWKSHW